MMRRRLIAVVFVAGLSIAACSSPNAPAPAPGPGTGTGTGNLVLSSTITASLSRLGKNWRVTYKICFGIQAFTPDAAAMIVNRVDFTLFDAAGQVYRTTSAGSLDIGRSVAETPGHCGYSLVETDAFRPIAPRFRAALQAQPGTGSAVERVVDAAITNVVPPPPFVDSVTLVHDIPGNTLQGRRPIVFTAMDVTGPPAPYEYQFKINTNWVVRDWSADPVFVWDALTLNNAPTANGSYSCEVFVRRGNYPPETDARVNFTMTSAEAEPSDTPFATLASLMRSSIPTSYPLR